MAAALSREEQACVYASLILLDDKVDVTADKITVRSGLWRHNDYVRHFNRLLQAIFKAANISDVEPFWPSLFAKSVANIDAQKIITAMSENIGGGEIVTLVMF